MHEFEIFRDPYIFAQNIIKLLTTTNWVYKGTPKKKKNKLLSDESALQGNCKLMWSLIFPTNFGQPQ